MPTKTAKSANPDRKTAGVRERPVPPDQKDSSRERLLDAAETLFAEVGYSGISVREISARAEVNLGSIPYYFGTKENLLKEVLIRRVGPINEERRRLLEIAMAVPKPTIESILHAVLGPAFRSSRELTAYRKLAGRLATDPTPEVRKVMDEIYNPRTLIFPKALRSVCPHVDIDEFNWRLMCVYGSMFYVQADTGRMQTVAGAGFDTSDPELALEYVVPFLAAGLSAPSGRRRKKKDPA
ncbi:TetR/AcrR family transcriptional regulator [Bradyrhizobium sp.]|uniref:TetR/AcrR family transcriptional regulator n=1 Tax=Bradyrhizobium sp. TaxID=376 RepID=UPI0039E6E590